MPRTTKDGEAFLFEESSTPSANVNGFDINTKFAAKYEQRKRKEELSKYDSKVKELEASGSGSDSESESEDEDGECLTSMMDDEIHHTLAMIRKKDPRIYNPENTFYSQVEGDAQNEKEKNEKEKKPVYYKDMVRQQILSVEGGEEIGQENKEKYVRTYQEEQDELRSNFLSSVAAAENEEPESETNFNPPQEDEKEDIFFELRSKSEQERQQDDVEFLAFQESKAGKAFKTESSSSSDQAFLDTYLRNKGWIDKQKHPRYQDIVNEEDVDDDEDAQAISKAEEFEHQYNFRFEEEGGTSITTHTRSVEGSMRRTDDQRKRKREERKERKAIERQQKEDQLRRLKNLKQIEIQEKLQQLGPGCIGINSDDLEEDFDPDTYDSKMQKLFDEEFYADEDGDEKPTWEDEDDAEDAKYMEENADADTEMTVVDDDTNEEAEADEPMDPKEMKRRKKKYLDELYALDYEDIIEDLPCRFKYRSVQKQNYGLTTDDILVADDKELNSVVALKRLAPFVDYEYSVPKFKIKHFRKQLLERTSKPTAVTKELPQEPEADTAEAEPQDQDPSQDTSVSDAAGKKKRKRKKSKKATVETASSSARKTKTSKTQTSHTSSSKSSSKHASGLSASRLESYQLQPLK